MLVLDTLRHQDKNEPIVATASILQTQSYARVHEAGASGLSTASRYSRTAHMTVSMSTRDGRKRGHPCESLAPPLSSTCEVWVPKQPNSRTTVSPLLPVQRTEASTYQDIHLWSQTVMVDQRIYRSLLTCSVACNAMVIRPFGKVPRATGHLVLTIKSSRNGRSIHKYRGLRRPTSVLSYHHRRRKVQG